MYVFSDSRFRYQLSSFLGGILSRESVGLEKAIYMRQKVLKKTAIPRFSSLAFSSTPQNQALLYRFSSDQINMRDRNEL